MTKYIYECPDFPKFEWDDRVIIDPLIKVANLQGKVLGKMLQFGFGLQQEAMLNAFTEEITKSSEIEGEILNSEQVRSSIARHLNMDFVSAVSPSHRIEGVVAVTLDAIHNYNKQLSEERLFGYHAALFPDGYSGFKKIQVARYRSDDIQVVSNKNGHYIVHYEAPSPLSVPCLTRAFLSWIDDIGNENPLIKAAIAHLWFVIIHPFDDGNGRITRVITDMMLARAENTSLRFYSMSAQIGREKKDYYRILELTTARDSLDITDWLKWFFECLGRSIENSHLMTANILKKAEFWQKNAALIKDEKQNRIVNLLLDGFEGNLTSGKAAKICKISQDTAARLLKDLADKGVLSVEGRARSTHYIL
ncbi:cell division protein Fic [Synergistales bacterium]|nr:cell division protein Fic [Synergistales bacterium]